MWRDSAAKLYLLDAKMWRDIALLGHANVERQHHKVIFIRRKHVERHRLNWLQKCGEAAPQIYFLLITKKWRDIPLIGHKNVENVIRKLNILGRENMENHIRKLFILGHKNVENQICKFVILGHKNVERRCGNLMKNKKPTIMF